MKKKTVFVGLSGGVDSSVSAALLKKDGYNVVGVFLKVWQPDFLNDSSVCTETVDRRDAMRVAAHLGIPFITLDCATAYKKKVVDIMIAEYRAGRVPNPDVLCNREVKFGVFLDEARKRGADFIATGHYARVKKTTDSSQPTTRISGGGSGKYTLPTTRHQLLRGVDKHKDQSYFLWTLTQEQLAYTLFPVGELKKKEVRVLAKKFGLPTAERKDSQGICFIGKADMKEFLQHFIPKQEGSVLAVSGKKIGTHDGAVYYAIGERHGFMVEGQASASPLYVVKKDIEKNTITVAPKHQDIPLPSDLITLEHTHWISTPPKDNSPCTAEVRYRGTPIPAVIAIGDTKTTVCLSQKEFVSTGQSLVLYDDSVCLGGGIVNIAQ